MLAPPQYGPKPELAWLPVADLAIDVSYQRDASSQQSRKIINSIKARFCWRDFQPLTVARRGDGSLAVTDGQHRLEAARELGIVEVPCSIFTAADVAEEAESFVAINRDRKQVTALDLFHAAVAGGDNESIATLALLGACGFKLARQSNPAYHRIGELGCIVTIQSAVRRHGEGAVRDALCALHEAYEGGGCSRPIDGGLVAGAAAVYGASRADARFDPDRMIATIGSIDNKSWGVAARPYRELHKLGGAEAMRAAIVTAYNRGLREPARLPVFAVGAAG